MSIKTSTRLSADGDDSDRSFDEISGLASEKKSRPISQEDSDGGFEERNARQDFETMWRYDQPICIVVSRSVFTRLEAR